MSAVLSVPVSDDLLVRLQEYAATAGKTPEAVLADCIAALPKPKTGRRGNLARYAGTFRLEADEPADPIPAEATGRFLRLAGSVHLDDPHAAEKVDEIIGDALLEELRGRPHE